MILVNCWGYQVPAGRFLSRSLNNLGLIAHIRSIIHEIVFNLHGFFIVGSLTLLLGQHRSLVCRDSLLEDWSSEDPRQLHGLTLGHRCGLLYELEFTQWLISSRLAIGSKTTAILLHLLIKADTDVKRLVSFNISSHYIELLEAGIGDHGNDHHFLLDLLDRVMEVREVLIFLIWWSGLDATIA